MSSALSSLSGHWSRLGFDTQTLAHLTRTALAAFAGLLIGLLLGLDHPQWVAMSVWASAQPLRGQALEKGLFRLVGSVIGVFVGVLFVVIAQGQPLIMAVLIVLWSTLCVGAAHLQRGYYAYGFILAGFSVAMVALLDFYNPQNVMAFGLDRLATVTLGVVIAILVALLFSPRSNPDAVGQKVQSLLADVLGLLEKDIGGEPAKPAHINSLMAEIARQDEALGPHSAGSVRHNRNARQYRHLMLALVRLTLWISRPGPDSHARNSHSALLPALRTALEAINSKDRPACIAALHKAAADSPSTELRSALERITAALTALQADAPKPARARTAPRPKLHRDWITAREAATRTLVMMSLMGAIWVTTGWSSGPYLMLGAAIMTTVFSVMDQPLRMMPHVVRGTLMGVAAALICRWLVWPHLDEPILRALAMAPFLLVGFLVSNHKRTAISGFDLNMHLLLLLGPTVPLSGSFTQWLSLACAIVSGPLAAWLAYRTIFPATLDRRLGSHARAMVHEVAALARHPRPQRRALIWQARLEHRMLGLSRWIEKSGRGEEVSATGGGMATLLVAEATLHLKDLAASPASDLGQSAALALGPISQLPDQVQQAYEALAQIGQRPDLAESERHLMTHASEALARHQAFFAKAA